MFFCIQLKQVGDISHQLRMLRDIFAKKAPQTLLKRCHSFLRFIHHLKDVGETFPGTEHGLYGFLCGLRDAGATTSNLQSVVQALNFAQHVVGLPELAVVTTSRRCIGAVGMRNLDQRGKHILLLSVSCSCSTQFCWTSVKIHGTGFSLVQCFLQFTAEADGWICNMQNPWKWTQISLDLQSMWSCTFQFTNVRSPQRFAILF